MSYLSKQQIEDANEIFDAWCSASWNRSNTKPPDGSVEHWFNPKSGQDRIRKVTDSGKFDIGKGKRKEKVDYIKKISEGVGFLWEIERTTKLASIIVLSQFPRKLYHNDVKAFEYDEQAVALTKKILEENKLKEYKYFEKMFVLLPLLHSESKEDANLSLYHFERIASKMKADPKCFSRCVNMDEFCNYVRH